MASGAVFGDVPFAVAGQASTHGVTHRRLGHRHLFHLAMAGLAFDLRANVRGVLELNLGFGFEAIDSLPRDLALLTGILNELFDARSILRELHMAEHTFTD